MHHTMKWLPVIAVCCVLSCTEPPPQTLTAEQTLQGFSDAIRKGDSAAAFALLSKESRALAEQRATAISAASGGMIKNEPMAMMSQTGFKTAADFTVKAVEVSESATVFEVSRESGVHSVRLLKQDGRWLIDLTTLFSERAP